MIRRSNGPLSPKSTPPPPRWDRNSSAEEDDPWLLMAKTYDDLAGIMDEDVAMALSAGQDQLDQLFESAIAADQRPTTTSIQLQRKPVISKNGLERFDWRLQAPSRIGETQRPRVGSRRYNLLSNSSSGMLDLTSNGQWSMNSLNQELQSRIVSRSLPTKELLKGSFTAAQRRKGLTLSELPSSTSTSSTVNSPSTRSELAAQHVEERLNLLKSSKEYKERWLEILSHERAAAEEAIQVRRQWPIEKLVQTGYAIDGLLAYWHGASSKHFGNRVATFKMIGSQSLPWNRFRPGDTVEVESEEMRMETEGLNSDQEQRNGFGKTFGGEEETAVEEDGKPSSSPESTETTSKKSLLTATVLEKGARHVKLYFEGESQKTDLEASSSWRLYQLHNDIAEVRIDKAFKSLDHDIEFLERANVPGKELVLSGSRISDILLDIKPPKERDVSNCFEGDMRIKSWMERYSQDDPLVIEGDPELGLNQSQMKAVAMMLKERVSLVQGVSSKYFSNLLF